ncbi:YihY/virulence factor BrkB family protein [Lentilactobacillus kefiri]|uniref:Ribonuclease BN n=2 Tax=Lentilactobacillus kefiri TaxID=33962 RepID=A0A8E1RG67_LENKE|nr:YihY/virulence factor BrkB family protein [Lentilactobacillus kefiri]KRL62186.1 ribonuclease BN [Lentilactobacillus parakefiri DSM 10551]KRM49459.1 ribonuclease BN [Lentilactobacillus kefiri DSM 20587 = JCM 5818]MCJ2161702.1 YihY/virulence factor BrkB family protein [Lentilactobacillus kefiri]MCP9368560.1 YihY/virulence factor BrkB family protein [Lentilactobacillus kefiri]MDM7492142.1 YihY/virulence factor BrkB family protein [Lentilactobacillus kefiri]
MKHLYESTKNFIQIVIKRYSAGNVSDSAAVLAFYTLLSIFPIFFIIGSVLNLFHIHLSEVEVYIKPLFPERIYSMLEPIINSTLQSGGASQLSVGLIVTIWSASRAIAAFQRSINKTYEVAENQNAISNRLISFVWMLVLVMAVVVLMFVFAFSQMFFEWLNPILNVPHWILNLIGTVKWPGTIVVAWLLLSLLFYIVPTAKVKFRYVWFGALIATLGLMILAQGFTFYLRFFSRRIDAYKTIGTFIVLMFWLDFSGIIMLFGGVINATIQEIRQGKIQEQQDALETVWKKALRKHRREQRKKKKARTK